MDKLFTSTSKTYEASNNMHSMQDGFKLLRFIDNDLSNYTKSALKLTARKSGNLIPSQLDEVLGFHSSLRSQIILDPFSCDKHKDLFTEISAIELSNLVSPTDLEILTKMTEQARGLLSRTQIPSLDFLTKITDSFDGTLLITFRRESTIRPALDFLDASNISNVLVDSLRRRNEQFADNNLIFGPIHWYQESIISNPRGSHLFAIMPAHIKFKQPEMTSYPDWFNFGKSPIFRDLDSSLLVLSSDETEDVDNIEYATPVRWIFANSSRERTSENQKLCRQIALANEKQVFIDVDGEQDFVHSVEVDGNNSIRKIEISPRDLKIGDYIILREGQSDTEVLYMKARELIGPNIDKIEVHQQEWKDALKTLLLGSDLKVLNRTLKDKGMKSVNRLSDWTDPNLRRPLRDDDFAIILTHLGLNVDKYLNSASILKRTILQVAVNFRHQLTAAIEKLDGSALKESGTHVITSPVDGVANLFISRVVGVSNEEAYVETQRIRIPFDQEGKK
jgi:hypothetical protein